MTSYQRCSCAQASEKMQQGAILLDTRDSASFAAGHGPGALNLTNQNVQDFVQAMLQSAEPEKTILVMCYHGHSSQQAAQYLVNQGLLSVFSVDGGFELWKLNFPVEK